MKKFDPETFGPLLGGTARAWRLKLDARLKPMGLSQAKWRTLLHLSRTPEPLTQSQIAERTGIEEPTLVTVLQRMGSSPRWSAVMAGARFTPLPELRAFCCCSLWYALARRGTRPRHRLRRVRWRW